MDSAIGFPNTYPLDNDLSGGYSAIQRINLYIIQWIGQLVSLIFIHWTVIYPVDSAIRRLNNRGQVL